MMPGAVRPLRSEAARTGAPVLAAALLLSGCGARIAAPLPGPPPAPDAPAIEAPGTPAALEDFEIPDVLPSDAMTGREIAAEVTHLFAPEGLDAQALETFGGEVQASLAFLLRNRGTVERWLRREGRYADFIRAELRAAGLPEDLLYLAMIESGFDPTALSRAGAVGLWQFMRPTAREAGLRVDEWVDERRDPVASTHAAIRHLRALQRQTGDWALTAAAYNAGLGRVTRIQRDVRAQGGADARVDYFGLTAIGRLPEETRRYVPLITAAAHIAHNRSRYGFTLGGEGALAWDTVGVPPRTRLSGVASALGIDKAALAALNPHILGAAVPPGATWPLRVPPGAVDAGFHARLAALPAEERILPEVREVFHTVAAGDSWWRIARRYGTSVDQLRARNPRIGEIIHPGQKLLVERRTIVTEADLAAAAASGATEGAGGGEAALGGGDAPGASAARTAAPHTHTVQPGETLWGLARRYGVRVADLVAWNDMAEARGLRIGEVLVVTGGG